MKASSAVEAIVLLGVLPILDQARHSWWLTAFPIMLLDNGWPRFVLPVLLATGMGMRILVVAIIVRIGDWVVAPLQVAVAALSIPSLLNTRSEAAVYSGLIVSSCVFTPAAYRSLAFRRFGKSPQRYRRALRFLTANEVFGYSIGSFVAGEPPGHTTALTPPLRARWRTSL